MTSPRRVLVTGATSGIGAGIARVRGRRRRGDRHRRHRRPVRSAFVHSVGALAVDGRHRVLDAQSVPIAGLYAAGATGQGGLLLKGHGHHLAWALVSGRRAGRFAAQEAAR